MIVNTLAGQMVTALRIIPIACVLILLSDAQQPGSLAGSVVDSNGKSVAGLALRLEKPPRISIKPPGGNLKKKKEASPLQTTKPSANVVAAATTDADGKFSMPNIAPGAYRIVGGNNSIGWVFQNVSVEAGKNTKLDLKLVAVKK